MVKLFPAPGLRVRKNRPKLYQSFDKDRTLSKWWRKNRLSVGAWITFIEMIWEKALRVLLQFLNLHTICTGPEWMSAEMDVCTEGAGGSDGPIVSQVQVFSKVYF